MLQNSKKAQLIIQLLQLEQKIMLIQVFLIACSMLCLEARISIKNHNFYDSEGGVRIFHGVNIVAKKDPYYYQDLEEKHLVDLKQLGMNGIRLAVSWNGFEPEEDKFNKTYIEVLKNFTTLAGKHGIFTLIEMHQDVLSQPFCGGGVPRRYFPDQLWNSMALPIYKAEMSTETLLPKCLHNFTWSKYYETYAANKGYEWFWNNGSGVMEEFGSYWKNVVEQFKDNPYVIGYELMNEPWPGDARHKPYVLVPFFAERLVFQKSYDYLADMIRKVDPQANIAFEPVTWLNSLPTGFTHPPGGQRYGNNSILSYHIYDPPVYDFQGFMKARVRDIKRLGTAGFLTEFMTVMPRAENATMIMDLCDKYSQSWLGWQYRIGLKLVPEVQRTYAQRIAGDNYKQWFSNSTKRYTLTYYANPSAGKTRIFIGKSNYPEGYCLQIYPTKIKVDRVQDIYLDLDNSQIDPNTLVIVIIERTSSQKNKLLTE